MKECEFSAYYTVSLTNIQCTPGVSCLAAGNSWTHLLGSTLLGSESVFPRHRRLPMGGGLVLVWRFREISAGIGDFSRSNNETIELEEASLSDDLKLRGLLARVSPLLLVAIFSTCKRSIMP